MFCINVIINNVFCDCSVVIATGFLRKGLKTRGHVFVTFCIHMVIQSLLYSNMDSI